MRNFPSATYGLRYALSQRAIESAPKTSVILVRGSETVIEGLQSCSEYVIDVRVEEPDGHSDWSSVGIGRTSSPLTSAPTNVQVSNTCKSSLNFIRRNNPSITLPVFTFFLSFKPSSMRTAATVR